MSHLPPGPNGLPLLGNILSLMRDPLAYLTQLTRTHGDVAGLRLGHETAVFINDPVLISRLIRDRSFVRGDSTRRGLAGLLGQGLLSLEGAPHLRHRRLMQPAFHRERIQRYVAVMIDETYRAIEHWRSQELRDLRGDMMHLTFAIVARALFNADTRHDSEKVDAIMQRVLPAVMSSSMLSRVIPFEVGPLFGKKTRSSIAELHALVDRLVHERRAAGGDRGDLLSMLLATRDEDGSALNDEDIRAEALTILLAGHDTTAHTMTWAWYLLSTHPQIQQAVADEVRGVVGDRQLLADDLPRLPLVDRVVRETLRLYPAAWWGDRLSDEPADFGGYRIPAKTLVVFSAYVTQRDPRYFSHAERFDPDRFLPERAESIPDGAYLPFGGGVHACIGNNFALMEAKTILAAMAQRFVLQAPRADRVRPRAMVTLGMAEPFHVVLTRRAGLPHEPCTTAT